MRKTITGRLAALPLAATLLAACGGGGGNEGVATLSGDDAAATATTAAPEDLEAQLLDWVECMRGEGLDISDPTVDADGNLVLGGGPGGGPNGDTDEAGETDRAERPDREAMDAAQEVCGDAPESAFGGPSEADLEGLQEASLQLAQCMRDEGIDDFPDPDFSSMGPGAGPPDEDDESTDNSGNARQGGPFGDIDMDDPEVQAASETCRAKLADAGVEMLGPGGAPGASDSSEPSDSSGSGDD